MASSSSSGGGFLPDCIFAPYFPPEEPQKFANVQKIFGASNISKLLNEVLPHQRKDTVNSLAYEVEAKIKDPVYGCVGATSFLQRQIMRIQNELDDTNADLIRYACREMPGISMLGIGHPSLLNVANYGNGNDDLHPNPDVYYYPRRYSRDGNIVEEQNGGDDE